MAEASLLKMPGNNILLTVTMDQPPRAMYTTWGLDGNVDRKIQEQWTMLSTHSSTARVEISLASRNATLHSVAWLPRTASAEDTFVPVHQLDII